MDILQYLIALLKVRKQIGIEGLGTLYKKKTPGRYDAETHSFLPPSYVLEFTTDMLENTNLAQYIQNERNISEESVKFFIQQFAEEVTNGAKQGDYTLENLGTFKSAGEDLTFSPAQDINTGFDFFALPAVTAKANETAESLKPADAPNETAETNTENLLSQQEEPEIEQVKVPEYEQEISKLDEVQEEGLLTSYAPDFEAPQNEAKANDTEEKVAQTEQSEEQTTEDASVHATEDKQEEPAPTDSFEDNEPTQAEVYNEITEVDPGNPTNEPNEASPENTQDEETWNFDDEHVVTASDIVQEKTATSDDKGTDEEVAEIDNNSSDEHFFEPDNKADEAGFTLTSTTNTWDFDNVDKPIDPDRKPLETYQASEGEQILDEPRKKPSTYLILGIVAFLLVAAAVVAYLLNPHIYKNVLNNTANPEQKTTAPIERSNLKTQQDSLSFADSIMQSAEKAGLKIEPAKDTIKVTTNTKPAAITYDIIIASFKSNATAQAFMAGLRKRGFDPKISTMHGKRKNISIATYNDKDSADKYVAKYKKQFANPQIYAQPIKNK
jgi:hypothetical protein